MSPPLWSLAGHTPLALARPRPASVCFPQPVRSERQTGPAPPSPARLLHGAQCQEEARPPPVSTIIWAVCPRQAEPQAAPTQPCARLLTVVGRVGWTL